MLIQVTEALEWSNFLEYSQNHIMDKYLCIDTNIFIQCCLLEEEGDDIGALDKLMELLEGGSVKLLLPEVVLLEFYKRLSEKTDVMQKQIDNHKKSVGEDSSLDNKFKTDIIDSLRTVMEKRIQNKDMVKKKIGGIFSHANTLKDDLKITADLIARAYKYNLNGKKPFKKMHNSNTFQIQADCLIIESLSTFLYGKDNYELYFCSLNDSDFTDDSVLSNTIKPVSFKIHPDIKKEFHHIEYRKNLLDLLNEKFAKIL